MGQSIIESIFWLLNAKDKHAPVVKLLVVFLFGLFLIVGSIVCQEILTRRRQGEQKSALIPQVSFNDGLILAKGLGIALDDDSTSFHDIAVVGEA